MGLFRLGFLSRMNHPAVSSLGTQRATLLAPTGAYANRAAGQGGDRPEGCFTSEDDDHEVALSAQKSGIGTSWAYRLFLLR